MSTSVLEALPSKLDIKRHSSSSLVMFYEQVAFKNKKRDIILPTFYFIYRGSDMSAHYFCNLQVETI